MTLGRMRQARDIEDIHIIYTTLNREYHVLGGICFAVRCLETGRLMDEHPARGAKLIGTTRGGLNRSNFVLLTNTEKGDELLFRTWDGVLRTSRVVCVEPGTDLLSMEQQTRRPATEPLGSAP